MAKKFHEGQKRPGRGKTLSINHVKFVSDQVLPLGEEYALVGMLHDTLEDTAMDRGTLEQLFGKTVADAVALLTHDKKVPYLDYVRQIKESGNPYAIAVKKADLRNNMDLTRLPEVTEKDNAALLGYGVALTKYTGARGKAGSNDANSEFIQKIRTIFNEAGVAWQIGELGKVDQGGGGTIAFMLADWGCEVVDCGTAMLSMHAPMDLVSKADAYTTYLAYKAFFESR